MVHNYVAKNVTWVIWLEVFTEQNSTVQVFIDLNWERQSYGHFRFNEFYGKNRHGVMPIQSTRSESESIIRALLDPYRTLFVFSTVIDMLLGHISSLLDL